MEFDEQTGRPKYRLHAGLSGRSRALSVAHERGIPETVLGRAREIHGDAWQRREAAEAEAEQALERLRAAERELAAEREAARREAQGLEEERRRLAAEREKMLAEGLAGFERARAALSRRVSDELDAARTETSRLAQASAARVIEEAERDAEAELVIAEAREAEELRARTVEPGSRARVRGLGAEGTVVAFEGDWAQLDMAGKRLRVKRSDLEPAGPAGESRKGGAGRSPRGTASRLPPAASRSDIAGDTAEVLLIGMRLEEAIEAAEKALDQAVVAGAARLRLVHGHGTGRLRDGLRDHFRKHPSVATMRKGERNEGGDGATMLELR
jgi:DNA mismatch repair protein MutS2